MTELSRVIRNIKKNTEFVLTPRLDAWFAANDINEFCLTKDEVLLLERLLGEQRGSRVGLFTGSQAGSCERAQMFAYLGMPKRRKIEPMLQNRFLDGRWRHARWQLVIKRAIPGTFVEVPVVAPSLQFQGSLDAVNMNEGWGFELKGWSNMTGITHNGVVEYHEMQAARYWLATDEDPNYLAPIDKWVFMYEDKRSNEWKEIVVKRSDTLLNKALRELRRLNRDATQKKLPTILAECSRKQGSYNQCPYKAFCLDCDTWDEAVAYRDTGSFLVKLQPTKSGRKIIRRG